LNNLYDLDMHEKNYKQSLAALEDLNRKKSMFISTLSHDFRTSLTAISMNLQMLEMYDQKWTPQKKETLFKRLKKSMKTMIQLLDEVSMLSKSFDGKLTINLSELDFVAFCRDYAEKVNSSGEYSAKVVFETTLSTLPVHTDSSFFGQVVNNLVINAVKFSPAGEEVRMTLTAPDGFYAMITIIDKGIGIPENDIKKIFDPFYRSDNALQYPGSGLGLPVALSAVELLNGSIEIESIEDQGTKVTIKLPLNKAI
jgi:signal transduction histidine kinase